MLRQKVYLLTDKGEDICPDTVSEEVIDMNVIQYIASIYTLALLQNTLAFDSTLLKVLSPLLARMLTVRFDSIEPSHV